MGDEIDFLPTYKQNNFLKLTVSLWVCMLTKACQKYPKQQVYNIFEITQGKCKGWSSFSPAHNYQRFIPSDTIILDVCHKVCPNYPIKKVGYSAIS